MSTRAHNLLARGLLLKNPDDRLEAAAIRDHPWTNAPSAEDARQAPAEGAPSVAFDSATTAAEEEAMVQAAIRLSLEEAAAPAPFAARSAAPSAAHEETAEVNDAVADAERAVLRATDRLTAAHDEGTRASVASREAAHSTALSAAPARDVAIVDEATSGGRSGLVAATEAQLKALTRRELQVPPSPLLRDLTDERDPVPCVKSASE